MNNIDLKPHLREFFEKQKYCDVKFVCNDAEGKVASIGAHKLILALVSDVFEVMFFGESLQSGLTKETNEIEIPDIGMDAFKLFLGFIYGQSIEFDSSDTVAEFFRAAHKYHCKDAFKLIKNYMIENVDIKTSTIYYETAVLYDFTDLKEACEKVFATRTKDIFETSEFLTTSPETVEAIFKQENATVELELEFVRALERYMEHQEESDAEIKMKIRPALNWIRFLALTPADTARTTLLTAVEIRDVIICQTSVEDLSKMPVGFSLNKNDRGALAKLAKELGSVFSESTCVFCTTSNRLRNRILHSQCNSDHSFMSCTKYNPSYFPNTTCLKIIYQKYNHYNLLDYSYEDLQKVYDICKKNGLLEQDLIKYYR